MDRRVAFAKESYQPPPNFVEDAREALIDFSTSDSTELWLIQWPNNLPPDFDGQELTIKLNRDGKLGTFEGSSGKEYELVSFAAQQPDATVFASSSSGSEIVGKISRRVSIVHYPSPNELEKLNPSNPRPMYQRSFGASLTNASQHFSSLTPHSKLRSSQSSRGNVASMHSSRQRSIASGAAETSKSLNRKHTYRSPASVDRSTQNSERHHSAVTSESMGHSRGQSDTTSAFQEHSRGHGSAASSGSTEHSNQKSKKMRREE